MSVTIRELYDSRAADLNAKDGGGSFHFYATTSGETSPENAVYVAILTGETYAPYVWNNLVRGKPSIKPLGNNTFDVTIPYRRPDGVQTSDPAAATPAGGEPSHPPPQQPNPNDLIDNGVSLEIGGKPPRIFKSLKTISRQSPNGLPPDYQGLINVGQDGKAEGVEIPDPAVVLTRSVQFDYCTWGYADRVFDCCFKTNDRPFLARGAGELMLTGASLKVAQSGKVDVSFKFGVDKGEQDIPYGTTAGGAPLTVDRGPWEYVWFAYAPDVAAGETRLGLTVIGVYVEQIVKRTDYRVLGIG